MAAISHSSSFRAPLAGTFSAFANLIVTWRQRSKERQELSLLDARSLRDLGLNPGSIQFEANKPFWID